MKVKSESEVAQSCPTPSYPMDCSTPGSSFYGIFQARVLEWGAIAFSQSYLEPLAIEEMELHYRAGVSSEYNTDKWRFTAKEQGGGGGGGGHVSDAKVVSRTLGLGWILTKLT